MKKLIRKIKISIKRRKRHKKKFECPKFLQPVANFFSRPIFKNQFFQVAIISFLLMLYVEGFGHSSFIGGFKYLFTNPIAFFANMLIMYATLSIAWLFKRRVFFYVVVSALWIILGTVNGIILMYRMTPFTTADLQIIDMGLDILPSYLTTAQLRISVGALILIGIIFITLFIIGPKRKEKINYKIAVISIVAVTVFSVGFMQLGIKVKALDEYFENLWDAYERSGVAYCFLNTWLNKGIRKPINYSEEAVNAIMSEKDRNEMTYEETPNIIFLQMESFIDPEELLKYEYSEEVTPFFNEMKKNYSTGHLKVPVIGGGTANTEFEVMSGMSLRFFGPGEYPYKSILMDQTSETMAYNLKKIGYATHAIHNHRGAFYNRNLIFANLGFDDFTSLEYMNYVSKTPKNYATDDVLQGEIIGAMSATEEQDYIYAISVQGHGEYPKTAMIPNPQIVVTTPDVPKEIKNAYEYYIAQVSEMDYFLKQLTKELETLDEKVVLVVYGDHLPALGMTDEETVSGSTFKTEYVIWSNYEREKQDKNLTAYQLSAEVQRQIGMKQGIMSVFHQENRESPSYLDDLHMLQYDMLYGKKYIYGGTNPFESTDIKMGFRPIKINSIEEVAREFYIVGEGFTPYSKVSYNGRVLETIFLGPTLLKLIDDIDPSVAKSLKVSQVEKYDAILSTTE